MRPLASPDAPAACSWTLFEGPLLADPGCSPGRCLKALGFVGEGAEHPVPGGVPCPTVQSLFSRSKKDRNCQNLRAFYHKPLMIMKWTHCSPGTSRRLVAKGVAKVAANSVLSQPGRW